MYDVDYQYFIELLKFLKMKKLKFIIFVLFIGMWNFVYSQNIRGKVVDSKTGNALPGVVVAIPELNKGTVTNDSGEFEIKKIPAGSFKMQLSYMGYKTIIESFDSRKKDFYNFKMSPSCIETEEVVVSGGTFSPAHTNAVKVESINISRVSQSPTLSGFLATIPGVDLIRKGNAVTKPVIRGLSGTNILVLRDGFRLEDYQFSEDHPFLVDKDGIDRVEVIKGPASLLYGSDAIGGVINFITEKPAPVGKMKIDYSSSYFSNGGGINQGIGIKASRTNFMWGIRGGLRTSKDFYDGSGRQVLNTRFNRQIAKAFAVWNTNKAIFRLFYTFSANKFGMSVKPALPMVKGNSYQNKVFYQDLHNNFVGLKNTFFLSKLLKLKVNLSYENNDRALDIRDTMNPAIHMNLQTLTYETKLEAGNDIFTFIGGLQGYGKFNRNLSDATSMIIPAYVLNTNAVYSLLKWNAFRGFYLQTGLRYEMSGVKIPSQDYYNLFQTDTSLFFHNLSGSFGATYKVSNDLNLRLNFASGYRMPNLPELTQYGVHGYRFEEGNMDLKSQRSYETDFSVHYHTNKFLFDIAAFYNKINDYIFLSPTNDTSTNGMQVYKYLQSNAEIYGFETGMEYFPIDNLDLKLSYNYTLGRQEKGYLPLIPQNKLRIKFVYHLPDFLIFRQTSLSLSDVYAFAQNNVSQYENRTAAYDLLNFHFDFKNRIGKQLMMWEFGCNNIFDQKYNDHLSTLKDVGYFDMGRSFFVSLKLPLEMRY
jgi:iron complex outermembrane receptor protein